MYISFFFFFFRYRDVEENLCFAKRIIKCSVGNERGKVSQRGCCYVYTYKKFHETTRHQSVVITRVR